MSLKNATCLRCRSVCYPDCDYCFDAICDSCENILNKDVEQERRKLANACTWCTGTQSITDFCADCHEAVQKRFDAEMKLGPLTLSKKYETSQPITKEQVWKLATQHLPWTCRCYSGIRCGCDSQAVLNVFSQHQLQPRKVDDYCPQNFDPQFDCRGCICTNCQRNNKGN